ncbi:hypothetical protein Lfu02_02240 [Longispora fulva]|uniref:Uncharacterized protein n=1 Tax=Longispora fulva TaxID=619741 RepID=A0A8J7GD92_9ACTN|nr:hypothetical protein [Longispora fulva]MBG6135905.1 hypothetical protein [Longispora fulva]GIG55852.1 hypothetical protein Lfu02_02240 [Longispora fulva]
MIEFCIAGFLPGLLAVPVLLVITGPLVAWALRLHFPILFAVPAVVFPVLLFCPEVVIPGDQPARLIGHRRRTPPGVPQTLWPRSTQAHHCGAWKVEIAAAANAEPQLRLKQS